jgi:hypothetical protein
MLLLTAEPGEINTLKSNTPVICVICRMAVEPYNVTAGSLYADGRQAFACTTHLRNRRCWVNDWVVFETQQRIIRRQGATQ